jgi:hypothetical protein
MLFPWYQPKVNEGVRSSNPSWRDEMHRREIQARATLMYRLGRSRDEAVAAIGRYVAWEYDGLAKPAIQGEIGRIVDAVYQRQRGTKR